MNHKYSFHCVWSEEDDAFIACVPELPGCKADGHTQEEAIGALDIVVSEWIDTAKEQGRAVPNPMTVDDYVVMQKKFRDKLNEHVKRAVENAVKHVIQNISHFNPVLTGGKDPADFWKDSVDC